MPVLLSKRTARRIGTRAVQASVLLSVFFLTGDRTYKNNYHGNSLMDGGSVSQLLTPSNASAKIDSGPKSSLRGTRLSRIPPRRLSPKTKAELARAEALASKARMELSERMKRDLNLPVSAVAIEKAFKPIAEACSDLTRSYIDEKLNAGFSQEQIAELLSSFDPATDPSIRFSIERAFRKSGAGTLDEKTKNNYVGNFFGIEAQRRDLISLAYMGQALEGAKTRP